MTDVDEGRVLEKNAESVMMMNSAMTMKEGYGNKADDKPEKRIT